MTLKGPEFKKALLLGLVLAAVPVFFYPNTFGWSGAASGGTQLFLVEMLYYLLVFQFLFSREPFAHRFKAAATALAFRFSSGVVFAVLATGLFNLAAKEALNAGLYGYLPGVLLQIAVVPFLLKPVFRFRELRSPRLSTYAHSVAAAPHGPSPAPAEQAVWTSSDHAPDFEAAVQHVASYSTVGLVLLVDEEGLCVARAARGQADSDLWAPVINLLYAAVIRELGRTSDAEVKRIQVTLAHDRLVVERVAPFYLAVLFDQNTDELVNVRIAQAVEMVKRYYEHKYPKVAETAATEVAYV
jgi:predicted regulator of Ras-like GTPase activity (Roadblock/LC7/MglB family)